MTLVVILTVRLTELQAFRTFETRAAAVMAKHGGALERAIVVPGEPGSETLREVHVVTFPHAKAFAAYRDDADLAKILPLRAQSVITTEVLVGEEGPAYGR